MSFSTKRGRPWRSALAFVVACAALLAFASTSHAGASYFCPAGGGFITLGAGSGCTNSDLTLLTRVEYYNAAAPYHCAVGKATADPGGASSNLWEAGCGYGAIGDGMVGTTAPGSGRSGYARGKNDDAFTYSGFYGIKYW